MDWGRSFSLIFATLVNMDVCQKTKRGNVSSATFIICDPLYKNRTYEAISNFEKVAKIYFVSNMASRWTVLLKPFASKRYFLVYQQNLVVELYCHSRKDTENLVAFPMATVKLKTVKGDASIEHVTISLNFVQL